MNKECCVLVRKDDNFSTPRPAEFVNRLVIFCKGSLLTNLQSLSSVRGSEEGACTLFLQWRKNMFSRKEIMFWVFAAIAGITLAYACRLEAMI